MRGLLDYIRARGCRSWRRSTGERDARAELALERSQKSPWLMHWARRDRYGTTGHFDLS